MEELSPENEKPDIDALQDSNLPSNLQTCVTIRSGEAVAEASGLEGAVTYTLIGQARNDVARLSLITDPGTIVVSHSTRERVKLFFECESLGSQRVRGLGQTVETFRVLKEAASRNRVELVDPCNLTPLVGRDTELAILRERWEQAVDHLGQIVLLIGDAGLGKSRLIRELREHVIAEEGDDVAVIELRCSQYQLNATYFPLVEYLSRLLELDH